MRVSYPQKRSCHGERPLTICGFRESKDPTAPIFKVPPFFAFGLAYGRDTKSCGNWGVSYIEIACFGCECA